MGPGPVSSYKPCKHLQVGDIWQKPPQAASTGRKDSAVQSQSSHYIDINKINTLLNYNINLKLKLLSRSPNSIFTTKKDLSLVPILINLVY